MMKKEIIEVDRAKMQSMVDIPSLGDVVKTALAVEVKKKDHEMSGLRSTYLRQIEIGTEDMVEMAAVNNKNLRCSERQEMLLSSETRTLLVLNDKNRCCSESGQQEFLLF